MSITLGKRILGTWMAISLPVLPLTSQQSPPQTPPPTAAPPPLILRSTTRLVQVSVIVHGKDGQTVTGLKKEDFTLTDNGKPQQISVFSMQSSAPLPKSDEKLPPNVFTNRLEQRSGAPASVTVILLDSLNTRWQDQSYARQQLIKFLQQIQPEDRIAIYALGRGLRVLHDYTTDASELLKRLNQYRGQNLPDLGASEQNSFGSTDVGMLDSWLQGRGASGAEADFYTMNRVKGTLRAIEFIADHLAAVPGRKNLIWVSGGFPLQIGFNDEAMRDPSRMQMTFTEDVDRTVRAVNDANLAIYPVDARGLVADPAFSAEKRSINVTDVNRLKHITDNQGTMQELASRTGGRAYYNTNDLNKAIREAVEDAKVTYTLGFYPAEDKYDGKFHKLNVKVNQPGLSVRFRKGYLDSRQQPVDAKVRQKELHDSVWSPLDATAIGVNIAVVPDADKNQLRVGVQIDPRNLSLETQGERHNGRVDLLFVQKDNQGHQFNGTDDVVELRLLQDNYRKLMDHGLFYQKLLDRHPQATQLRVVVRDAASGSMGSITVPFKQLVAADKMQHPARTPGPAQTPAAPLDRPKP